MSTSRVLWPKQTLEGFEAGVRRVHTLPGLPLHELPDAADGLDVNLVKPILQGSEMQRGVVRDIMGALAGARLVVVDLDDEGGSPALRAAVATGPMPKAAWLSLQLRFGDGGSNEELTTRIGLPLLGREVIENRWSRVGRALQRPVGLNSSEKGVGDDDGLYVALQLALAFTGLLKVLWNSHKLPFPTSSPHAPIPRQVARGASVVT